MRLGFETPAPSVSTLTLNWYKSPKLCVLCDENRAYSATSANSANTGGRDANAGIPLDVPTPTAGKFAFSADCQSNSAKLCSYVPLHPIADTTQIQRSFVLTFPCTACQILFKFNEVLFLRYIYSYLLLELFF